MNEADTLSKLVLLTGVLVVCNILIAAACKRLRVPALVGYLVLGFVLGILGNRWGLLGGEARTVLEFLAKIGVVALLFRVGLESKPAKLLHQLRKASGVAVANVAISGALAYLAASWLLDLGMVTSLIIATASVATSVGLTVGVWREADALDTPEGGLLVDVAEIDDVLGVVLMALLFAVVPTLLGGNGLPDPARIGSITLVFTVKLLLFGAFCGVFAKYAEKPITGFFSRISSEPAPMLVVAGIGFTVAALAGLIGFSVAIGAFFAGLMFSRDERAEEIDDTFDSLYQLFTPFFFIGIGLMVDLDSLGGAMVPAGVLVAAAVVGKLLGAGAPLLATTGWSSALVIGVSLVPRAEIFMVVMERGARLGEKVVPPEIFSAMILVSAATCFFTPLLLNPMLRRNQSTTSE